jgi:hypothetical protein
MASPGQRRCAYRDGGLHRHPAPHLTHKSFLIVVEIKKQSSTFRKVTNHVFCRINGADQTVSDQTDISRALWIRDPRLSAVTATNHTATPQISPASEYSQSHGDVNGPEACLPAYSLVLSVGLNRGMPPVWLSKRFQHFYRFF